MKLDKSIKIKGKTLRQIKESLKWVDALIDKIDNPQNSELSTVISPQFSGYLRLQEGWNFCWSGLHTRSLTFGVLPESSPRILSKDSPYQSLSEFPAFGNLHYDFWSTGCGTIVRSSTPRRIQLFWKDKGELHREGGPASILAEKKSNGSWILDTEEYYWKGQLHNLEGPACRWAENGNSRYLWCFYGNKFTKGQIMKIVNNPLNISKRQQAYLKLLYYPRESD